MKCRRHVWPARPPPKRSAQGMTLLELVVGLTVTGMVMTVGFGALQVLTDRREHVEGEMNAAARAANQRVEIESWLAGARLLPEEGGPAFRGLDGVHEGEPDDELSFVTTSSTPIGVGETLVRLYVDRDPATPEQGLTASFAQWRGTTLRPIEIDRRVGGLDARYWSTMMGERTWLPSWISSTVLPAGIELRFVPMVGDTLPPLLQLPLLVPLGVGR